jgi:cysteine desulfuration protein SufE
MDIDEITETFALLDDWEERYRYVIELGRALPPFPEAERTREHEVQGCVSRVWLVTRLEDGGPEGPVIRFLGDSDAHIVRGLVAILIALFSGRSTREILAIDAEAVLDRLGLREHLTPQRSNGLIAMVRRIRHEAEAAQVASA